MMMSRASNIEALLSPRSVALVGASDKNWSQRVWHNLQRFGFEGPVYPINPNRREIWGVPCYASVEALPEAPDHVALFVPHEQSLQILEEAGRRGCRSASIYAAGFGEGHDPAGLARAARLSDILDTYSIAATGPNCMGLAVGRSKFCTFPDEQVEPLAPGPVAALTQSGMLAQTVSRGIVDAGLTLAYLISLGNQTGLTFADYISHLADDPELRVITCYIESVIDGPRFLAAAEKARQNGKAVVVVKAGGSEAARAATLAHTGSLAGSTEVFDAFSRRAGIVRVDTLEDMIEAAAFLARLPRPKGRRIAVMTNSGAMKSLLTDAADRHDVILAPLTQETERRILAALPDADVGNPFDTKRTLSTDEYMACVTALHDDPTVDVLLLAEELPRAAGIERKVRNLTALDRWAGEGMAKPVAIFSPVTLRETDYMRGLRREISRLPMLRDLGKTVRTVGRIVAAQAPIAAEASNACAVDVERWRSMAKSLKGPTALNEAQSKELLAAYGLRLPREDVVASPQDAIAAATRIGFPVVLKAVSAAVPHKSDAGLVLLGLRNAEAVGQGAESLARRCAALQAPLEGILVAEQVTEGIEMVLGLHRDPEMGPAIMVGMGGVWLELFKDVAFAPPDLDLTLAIEAIATTRASKLLQGYRGGVVANTDALARAMVGLGRMARDLGDCLQAVDVNPILVTRDGAIALDGLVVLQTPT
jgi:acyl-CoA synthetase (NDP forming)